MNIKDIINRRTDLSTFVVHLTRDGETETAKERLKSILAGCPTIEARTAYGLAKNKVEAQGPGSPEAVSQRCVCFTETPLEHLHLLVQDIELRQFKFAPYGIATTKKVARRRGVNPVWYIDQTKGHDWLANPLNEMIETAFVSSEGFVDSAISKITPFIESMGTWDATKKEFWWEREWRHVGHFGLTTLPLAPFIGLCPEGEMDEFREHTSAWPEGYQPKWLDPRWGLEQIIARLAGFKSAEIEVF